MKHSILTQFFLLLIGSVARLYLIDDYLLIPSVSFAISEEHGLFVECDAYDDLMTIYAFDGELKFNIYGPNWGKGTLGIAHLNLGGLI